MNNIDKEIEDFKNNLLTIDKLSKDLNNNNDKLEKVLKETTELDNVIPSLLFVANGSASQSFVPGNVLAGC